MHRRNTRTREQRYRGAGVCVQELGRPRSTRCSRVTRRVGRGLRGLGSHGPTLLTVGVGESASRQSGRKTGDCPHKLGALAHYCGFCARSVFHMTDYMTHDARSSFRKSEREIHINIDVPMHRFKAPIALSADCQGVCGSFELQLQETSGLRRPRGGGDPATGDALCSKTP